MMPKVVRNDLGLPLREAGSGSFYVWGLLHHLVVTGSLRVGFSRTVDRSIGRGEEWGG